MPTINTPEAAAQAAKLFKERHGSGRVIEVSIKPDKRIGDMPAPRSRFDKIATIFFMVGTAAVLSIMFLGLLAVCLT